MNKVRHYEVTLESDVFAISLVTDPAIEVDFMALSKDKPLQVLLESDERRILVGCVLVPDKPIYRNMDGKEFYIQFNRQTIEKLAHDYLMNDRIYSFTTQHEEIADDVAVIESWIKEGKEDKSERYGIDVPEGSWMIMAKVNNPDIWERVKSGELKGFSVESFVSLKELDLSKINNMDEKEVKLEQIEVNQGFWDRIKSIIVEAIAGNVGQEEAIEEVERIEQEVVAETEVETSLSEDTAEEAVEPQTVNEAIVDDVVAEVVEESQDAQEVEQNLQEVIDQLNNELERLRSENEALRAENTKLSKQPSTKPVTVEMKKEANSRDVIEKIYNGTYFK